MAEFCLRSAVELDVITAEEAKIATTKHCTELCEGCGRYHEGDFLITINNNFTPAG